MCSILIIIVHSYIYRHTHTHTHICTHTHTHSYSLVPSATLKKWPGNEATHSLLSLSLNTHTHTMRLSLIRIHTILECNNQFVKVEYDPSTTTISCVFENESDLSQKSCSVEYGMCDKATNMYVVQNSTTEDSPSTVTLKLSTIATNSKNCYVVTARFSNDTLTVMVKGSFETQSSNNMDVIVGAVIGVIMGLVAGIAIITITIVACFITRRRTEYGILNLAVTK